MIIRTLDDVKQAGAFATGPTWTSARYLVRGDGLGYSLHLTHVRAGAVQEMEYRHHVEANLCVAGEGELEVVATGARHPIAPGMMYTLDGHERHIVRAHTEITFICVFTPAVAGTETHNADGGYDPA